MNTFQPWKIVHLELSGGLPALSRTTDVQGVYLFFWQNGVPVGHREIPTTQLPMTSAALADIVRQCTMPTDDGDFSPTPAKTTSVVVCTRDRTAELEQCLVSLQKTSCPPREILVIDNAPSTDSTRRLVAEMPAVKYVLEPRPGLNIARNSGVRCSTGDLIVFTDDDVTHHPDWIGRLQCGFDNPKVMAVTGLTLPSELETDAQWIFETNWSFNRGFRRRIFDDEFFEQTRRFATPVWEIGAGANMAFRRSIFELVGDFDERLDVGAAGCSGDSEFWYRVLANGWHCLYEPTAVAFHRHRRDYESLNRQSFYYMRGHVVALLIQFEKHRHWGNVRRLLLTIPRRYLKLWLRSLSVRRTLSHRMIQAQIFGCLSGIKFYFLNRRSRATPHLR